MVIFHNFTKKNIPVIIHTGSYWSGSIFEKTKVGPEWVSVEDNPRFFFS